MTTTTDVNSTMNSFFRMTMHKLAFVFAVAAFTVGTPCFAAKFSKPQVAAIVAMIQGADAAANSAGPAAVATSQYAFAINQYGNAINTMVDDLSIPQPQSSLIKGSVALTDATATQAAAQAQVLGFQPMVNAVTDLANTIGQLQAALSPNLGTKNPNLDGDKGLFIAGANAGDTRVMGQAISKLGDLLFVFLNEQQ